MKKKLIILLLCNFCLSCIHENEYSHHTITFYNYSDKEIYVVQSDRDYPDTASLQRYAFWNQPQTYKVVSHGTNTDAFWRRSSYESSFKTWQDTLMVLVFDAEILEINKIADDGAVLQRYDLSLQDLQRLNWTLSYPPTESMKDIKMWPRFEKK